MFCTDPPEFNVPFRNWTLNTLEDNSFTFNCTPSDGNPAVYSYTFRKGSVVLTEGVSGSVLTINRVVGSNRGVYTCEVNNTVGWATFTWNLFVYGEHLKGAHLTANGLLLNFLIM